jgi:copper chaperone
MAALRFDVHGMRSRQCVRRISAGVVDVAGVHTVEVDLGAGTLRVTGTADPDEVRAAINRAGYDTAAGPPVAG